MQACNAKRLTAESAWAHEFTSEHLGAGMATIAQDARQQRRAQWRAGMRRGVKRTGALLLGGTLIVAALLVLAALATFHPTDPSLNTAAAGPVQNWMGAPGAWAADLLLSLWGPPVGLLVPLLILTGLRAAREAQPGRRWRPWLFTLGGITLIATAAALLIDGAVNGLPAGWGGAFGLSLAWLIGSGLTMIGEPGIVEPFRMVAIGLTGVGGLLLCWFGLGLTSDELGWISSRRFRREPRVPSAPREAIAIEEDDDYDDDLPEPQDRPQRTPVITAPAEAPRTVINDRVRPPQAAKRSARDRQPSLALGDSYQLPGLELLAPPPPPVNATLDKASLERNARLLESVLEDFSVKGEIVEVRPGPVVTMYELEPASGIKASRVIQLADDIARNMSALSARVATIPGRSVIGIELPNAKREMVTLSELIASEAFEDQIASLPLGDG